MFWKAMTLDEVLSLQKGDIFKWRCGGTNINDVLICKSVEHECDFSSEVTMVVIICKRMQENHTWIGGTGRDTRYSFIFDGRGHLRNTDEHLMRIEP